MEIVEIPTESIQLKDKVVPKHVVIFKDTIVYVGTEPQNAPNLIPKPPTKQLVDEDGDEYIQPYKNIPIIDPKDAF